MNTNEYPPRHIPGFRPLVPGEDWHRTDWTPDMLPDGWRPLLLGELNQDGDEGRKLSTHDFDLLTLNVIPAKSSHTHLRTRRPLPPTPPTFEYDGKTWTSHIPGDPCPVDGDKQVVMLLSSGAFTAPYRADRQDWSDSGHIQIIGYRIPDVPQDETDKLRERITELELLLEDERKKYLARSQHIADLEYDLRTALTPRPIAEAGPVQKGFERVYIKVGRDYVGTTFLRTHDTTHFYDIRLPSPDLRAEYDRAVTEAGRHYEAWLQAKGGVK